MAATKQPGAEAQTPQAPAANTDPANTAVAQTQTKAVDVKEEAANFPPALADIRSCFTQPRKAFVAAFPSEKEGEMAFAREINFAVQAMMNNSYLVTCARNNPDDLVNAIKNVALTGSTLNPTLKLAYLVPFKGKITLMASYMGLVDILVNSGLAVKVEAHPVFPGDDFEMVHGTNGYVKHRPDPWGSKKPEELLGCYFYVQFVGGGELFDTLSKDEIDDIKRRSPSVEKGKTSPWDTDYIEMAKKTAVRRAFKMCPKTGISPSKLKVVEAAFDYDEKVDNEWQRNQPTHKNDGYDEDDVEYVDVTPEN